MSEHSNAADHVRGNGRGGEGSQRSHNSGKARGGESRAQARRSRNRVRHDRSNPTRRGYREDRMAQRMTEPDLPDGLDPSVLGGAVLQDLRVLSKDNADRVARHLIMLLI